MFLSITTRRDQRPVVVSKGSRRNRPLPIDAKSGSDLSGIVLTLLDLIMKERYLGAQFCHCDADRRIGFALASNDDPKTSLHGLHKKSQVKSPPSASGITCSSERASFSRQIMHLSPSQGVFMLTL